MQCFNKILPFSVCLNSHYFMFISASLNWQHLCIYAVWHELKRSGDRLTSFNSLQTQLNYCMCSCWNSVSLLLATIQNSLKDVKNHLPQESSSFKFFSSLPWLHNHRHQYSQGFFHTLFYNHTCHNALIQRKVMPRGEEPRCFTFSNSSTASD